MSKVLFPAIVSGISTRKDKSLLIKLESQELNPETSANLMRLNQNLCYVLIKSDPVKTEEQEVIDGLESSGIEGKSQSQRIRGCYYILWKNKQDGFLEFLDYYNHKTEQLINKLKSEIDEKS